MIFITDKDESRCASCNRFSYKGNKAVSIGVDNGKYMNSFYTETVLCQPCLDLLTSLLVKKEEEPVLSNKERVLKYCREYQSGSTDDLIERDDVEHRIKKYPEDKDDWFYGCPHCWGLPEFEEKELCNFEENDKAFNENPNSSLIVCSRCWNLALENGDNK